MAEVTPELAAYWYDKAEEENVKPDTAIFQFQQELADLVDDEEKKDANPEIFISDSESDDGQSNYVAAKKTFEQEKKVKIEFPGLRTAWPPKLPSFCPWIAPPSHFNPWGVSEEKSKPKLIFVDGEPGAGTTKFCSDLNYLLNNDLRDISIEGIETLHAAPTEDYLDLPRLVWAKKEKKKPLESLSTDYTHPYFTDPSNYVGWHILKLVGVYKKREQTVHRKRGYTICDTSPFFLLESLLVDAMDKNYIEQNVGDLLIKAVWGLIAYLSTTYDMYRVWVNRTKPALMSERIEPSRLGGYTTETSGHRNFKFQALNKLAHTKVLVYDGEDAMDSLVQFFVKQNMVNYYNYNVVR